MADQGGADRDATGHTVTDQDVAGPAETVAASGPSAPRRAKAKDFTVFFACLAFVGGVIGMSFAAAPFYRMYCQLTGYNGTTQRAEQPSSVILDRKMTVTFDANVSTGLNWDFKPMQASLSPRIGEAIQANYKVTNRSPYPTKGQAVFNVTPMEAAVYFNKIECFCFTETVLQPGQTLEMPVVFYIDPDITKQPETKNIGTVTLSYTFYPHGDEKPVAGPVAGIAPDKASAQPKL